MKKNVVVPILVLAALTVVGVGAWKALQQEPAPEPESPVTEAALAEEEPALPEEEREEYAKKIHQLENEVARARASASVPAAAPVLPAAPQPEVSPMKAAMGELTKMMKDPQIQEMMRKQQKMMLDQTYGELFQGLSLQGEDLDTMKDLLIDKMMSGMESGMAMMNTSLSPAERQAEAKTITDAQETANQQIKAFLGEEDYEIFERYESTQMERTQVDLFKQSLVGEQKLAWEQEDALIALMHEETSSFQYSTDIGQNVNMPPTDFSDESMTAHLNDVEQLHERYVARASEVLDENQTAQFEESLTQFRSMQEMSYKMARSMFGGEGGGEGNDE